MDLTLRQDSKNTVANSLLATTYLGPKMDLEVGPVVFDMNIVPIQISFMRKSLTLSLCCGVKCWVETGRMTIMEMKYSEGMLDNNKEQKVRTRTLSLAILPIFHNFFKFSTMD